MRADYRDREEKATAWPVALVPPAQPQPEEIRGTLRQAFVASEQVNGE